MEVLYKTSGGFYQQTRNNPGAFKGHAVQCNCNGPVVQCKCNVSVVKWDFNVHVVQ